MRYWKLFIYRGDGCGTNTMVRPAVGYTEACQLFGVESFPPAYIWHVEEVTK